MCGDSDVMDVHDQMAAAHPQYLLLMPAGSSCTDGVDLAKLLKLIKVNSCTVSIIVAISVRAIGFWEWLSEIQTCA